MTIHIPDAVVMSVSVTAAAILVLLFLGFSVMLASALTLKACEYLKAWASILKAARVVYRKGDVLEEARAAQQDAEKRLEEAYERHNKETDALRAALLDYADIVDSAGIIAGRQGRTTRWEDFKAALVNVRGAHNDTLCRERYLTGRHKIDNLGDVGAGDFFDHAARAFGEPN